MPLGWLITVYRQADGGALPAQAQSPKGARIATWQAGLWGLGWLDELVKAGKAISLGGNGYPLWYTAPAECLLPIALGKPPWVHEIWVSDPGDILTDQWAGKTVVDRAAAAQCQSDEWLLVVVWDES
jgi:hypothetical protein